MGGSNRELIIVCENSQDLSHQYPILYKRASKIRSSKNLFEDFAILSRSSRLVISNSTFSWWAAFLSNADTVAPKQWFAPGTALESQTKNLYLSKWQLI